MRGQYGAGTVDGSDGHRPTARKTASTRSRPRRPSPRSSSRSKTGAWAGVPFYIRAGKRLAKRVTEVTVVFKQPPLHLFKSNSADGKISPNVLKMRIQPDEGISLVFGAKIPGPTTNVKPVEMHFSYADAFGKSSANGYERLLLDAMLGDGTLFAHRDGVEATWALFTPGPRGLEADSADRLPQLTRPAPPVPRLPTTCWLAMAASGRSSNALRSVLQKCPISYRNSVRDGVVSC